MEEHADKGKLDGLEVPETRLDIRDSRPIGVDQTIDFDSPNGPNAKAGNPSGLTQTIASSNSDGTATVSEPPVPSVELQTRQHLLSGVDTPGYILLDAPLEGGMGAVYRAWNIQLERVVALKLSKLEGNNSSSQDQLRTEAANLARIEHPSIASCYGFGHFDGFSFFEMQWIEGVTLHELIEFLHQHNLQRSLENRVVLQWGKSLTEALIYCQMRGLNHLDLKPKNVMLTSSVGRQDSHATVVEAIRRNDVREVNHLLIEDWCRAQQLRVLDFGLSKRVDDKHAAGKVSGTPAYIAPEQIEGRWENAMLADQYGVGGILYNAVTGQTPNRTENNSFRSAIENGDATEFCQRPQPRELNSTVSRDLEAITLCCLKRNPKQRYATLDDLHADFIAALELRPIAKRTLGLGERIQRYCFRHPYSITIMALLTFGLVLTAFLLNSVRQANVEAQIARQNDRETFEQAINALATFDKTFLNDAQLNLPVNLELAQKFKGTLFDLFELLTTRENLEANDRRRLAQTSERLASDQSERGDYELATKFYASTANQLNELYASKDATELDLEELIRVNIDWLSIKTQLKREMYPAKEILEDSLELIELSELASDGIRLYAIANHCRFKLLLEGRAGARNSADWLDKGFQLGNRVRPTTPQERRLAARSSLCLALVRYKGGLGSEPFAKWFDRSLELYESLFDQDTASNLSLNREYAAAINASTMPKVILLNQAIAKAADESEMTSAMEFSRQIEKDYKQASTLLANIAKTDPMNNRVLRSRVSSEWMLADFYCFQRENGLVANSNDERTHRQQCISLLQELEKRQPQEANSRQGQALQWFRLGRSHLIEQENEAALDCFEKLLQIEGWWQMNTFELADMVQTTHALAWYCNQRGRTLGIDADAFKQMLENQQTRLASFSEVVGKKFKVSVKGYWPILTSDSLNLFGDSYSECGPEWNRYLEVIEYQDK